MDLQPSPLGEIKGPGLGPFGLIDFSAPESSAGITQITQVVSTIVGFITIVAGIFFMFQFMIGGFNWISSAGDKQKLETAQNRISQGIIGLIIVVAAYSVIAIIGNILGVQFLNPAAELTDLLLGP